MFKETKDGQTHSFGDGCKPAHAVYLVSGHSEKCCEACYAIKSHPGPLEFGDYSVVCVVPGCPCHAATKDHIADADKMVAPKEQKEQPQTRTDDDALHEGWNGDTTAPPQTGIGEDGRSSSFSHSSKCSGVHQGAYCYPLDDIRGAIVGMTSAMLDNPDKDGIYPTTRFYERLEEYARSLILQAREEGKRENQLYAQESHERGYKSGYLQAIEDMEAVVERGEFRVVSYEAVDVEKSGTYYRKEDVTAHLQALKEKKPTNPT